MPILAVLERLAKNVEHMTLKFGQLIQKQHSIVRRQADFAGAGQVAFT